MSRAVRHLAALPDAPALAPRRAFSETRPIPRRGLSREESAMYVGVSPVKFDQMVSDRRMPPARRIDGRKVWDIRELDVAFDDLPREDVAQAKNSWDDV